MSCCKHDEDDEVGEGKERELTGNRFHRYPLHISCIQSVIPSRSPAHHLKWKERMNRKNMAVQIAYHYSYYMSLVVCVCSLLEAL